MDASIGVESSIRVVVVVEDGRTFFFRLRARSTRRFARECVTRRSGRGVDSNAAIVVVVGAANAIVETARRETFDRDVL